MRKALGPSLADDIAIDLGTANTLVHVVGRGIIIDEPSVVALRSRNGIRSVLAVGQKAKLMLGRAPEDTETIRPLRDGVIADFVAAEELLRRFIKRAKSMLGFLRPRLLICVPSGATPVERRAVYDTAKSAGARRVYMIEEPVAAALGAGLPVDDPAGSMVVDIGGGTTDVAVLSFGGVVQSRSLRCAGYAMDEAIIRYVRKRHQLLIGEANAERIKIEAGTAQAKPNGRMAEVHIRGRDLRQGRPKSIVLGPSDIAEALEGAIERMAEFVERALEDLPPELANDISDRGVYLTGGGALLDKLDAEFSRRLGIPFHVAETPLHSVIRGTAMVLEGVGEREHLLLKP